MEAEGYHILRLIMFLSPRTAVVGRKFSGSRILRVLEKVKREEGKNEETHATVELTGLFSGGTNNYRWS